MAGLAGAPGALAGDRELLRAVTDLPAIQAAADGVRSDAPDAVQRLYERARDLTEALRAAAPVGASCEELWRAAAGAARGHVLAAEGIDRLSPGEAAPGRRLAAAGTRRVTEARRSCRPGAPGAAAAVPEFVTPRSGEAFFGAIRAGGPRGAATAELRVDGSVVTRLDVRGPEVRLDSPVTTGRHDLRIVFTDDRGATGCGPFPRRPA